MRELLREIHWRDHTFALIRFAIAISLLIASLVYYLDSRSAYKQAVVNLDARIYANDEAEQFRDVLEENIQAYATFKDKGLIGAPGRLHWVESFRRVARRLDLPGVEFTLEQSRVAEQFGNAYWHPEVEVRVTDMKVTMRLSHEGDLYKLLSELEKEANGLFSVDRCDFDWLAAAAVEVQTTRLRGECHLRWYSLGDVTERWREDPGV